MDILTLAKTVRDRVEAPVNDAVTAAKLLGDPKVPLLVALTKGLLEPTYRVTFLAAASSSGVLGWLAKRPCDLESLAEQLGVEPQHRDHLRAWLDIGVKLGDLGKSEGCYKLRSLTARALAQAGNDPLAAMLEEVMHFQVPVVLHGPAMLRRGERFTIADQDPEVIARSTRIVQPFVEQAIARTVERDRPVRLLEVGCGSGVYVRHAAKLNPRLSALAIDMQKEVADQAAKNMAAWGLADRVDTCEGDLRTLDMQPQFDLVTLHNNIYYFPVDERVEAMRRARALLAPGGKLLVTTSCQGGNVGLEVLSLWFRHADFGGPLPSESELAAQMRQAGFDDVETTQLIPGEQYYACTGTNRLHAQP